MCHETSYISRQLTDRGIGLNHELHCRFGHFAGGSYPILFPSGNPKSPICDLMIEA